MHHEKKFLFTITTGRSGTAFLARLLSTNIENSIVHHELLGWGRFGLDTPDISHMTGFNSLGNTKAVQEFWNRKAERILRNKCLFYGESSHMLAKCGLLENIDHFTREGYVYIIELRRSMRDIVHSFINRYDFLNLGNVWLWYLDYRYPKNIVRLRGKPDIFMIYFWYILEMRARYAFYKRLFSEIKNIQFLTVNIEDIASAGGACDMLSRIGFNIDAAALILPAATNGSKSRVALSAESQNRMDELAEKISMERPEHYADLAISRKHSFYVDQNSQPLE